MSGRDMGLWAPGHRIHLEALDRQEGQLLAQVENEMSATTDPLRLEKLKKEIESIKADFAARRAGSKFSLF